MDRPPPLPLAPDELPEEIRRFVDPSAPAPARMMAARGLVPIKGNHQITMLAQLSADADEMVAKTATDSLTKLPEPVLLPACQAPLHPSVLDLLADKRKENQKALELIVANPKTADSTVEWISRSAPELLCEQIAVNEQRLLKAPQIIEALYKNRNTRMSTADRMVELAARNGLELTGIPSFQAHVEAVRGQLIPEPSQEPLYGDSLFQECLEDDRDDEAFEQDEVKGEEKVKEMYKPLAMRIKDMTTGEKIRLALVGSSVARALLVRDRDRNVAMAVVCSPAISLKEIIDIAKSRDISDDVLRYIGNRREWLRSGKLKAALVFNPRTPVGISLKFLSHLRLDELKRLARSRNVAAQIRSVAAQWVSRREKI
ncbi:MAG: hypothetical protein JXA30_03455 [Deltaproteobacteria bacterium]|nr:hypothetical protein [Deltaproteobacteria bacterium]